MIPQREHARLSYELAAHWGNAQTPPVLADSPAARDELLEAIRLHDEGWEAWEAAPAIDPRLGRPYGFTEMPPADAQGLWGRSVTACREIGPLAGWVVAGHFVHLQSKQDQDYEDWKPWLAEQQAARSGWLDEWLSRDPAHSPAIAEQALFLLQTFDWLSLWLCCRAPLVEGDPAERLTLHDAGRGFGPYELRSGEGGVRVSPWPFDADHLRLEADAQWAPARAYADAGSLLAAATPRPAVWRLEP